MSGSKTKSNIMVYILSIIFLYYHINKMKNKTIIEKNEDKKIWINRNGEIHTNNFSIRVILPEIEQIKK